MHSLRTPTSWKWWSLRYMPVAWRAVLNAAGRDKERNIWIYPWKHVLSHTVSVKFNLLWIQLLLRAESEVQLAIYILLTSQSHSLKYIIRQNLDIENLIHISAISVLRIPIRITDKNVYFTSNCPIIFIDLFNTP